MMPAMVSVDEFGDGTYVHVRVERGVWRELCVVYRRWDQRAKKHRAVFDDKRCHHVRTVKLTDINLHIANALTRLHNLEDLSVYPFVCADYFDPPPPGIWPQLRRLNVDRSFHKVAGQKVLSLVAAAPNLRELHIVGADGLHCLPAVLAGLPMLETLHLEYVHVDAYSDKLLDCERLDDVTPPMLLSMCLHLDDWDQITKPSTAAVLELTAALGRMQQRVADTGRRRRFAIELCGTHF